MADDLQNLREAIDVDADDHTLRRAIIRVTRGMPTGVAAGIVDTFHSHLISRAEAGAAGAELMRQMLHDVASEVSREGRS